MRYAFAETDADFYDIIRDPRPTPEEEMFMRDRQETIMNYLNKHLNTREREVLTLRFGLDGSTPMTLEEIGTVFGVTRERIRQIELKALNKLRRQFLYKKVTWETI